MDVCTSLDAQESGALLDQVIQERAKLIVVPSELRKSPKSVAGALISRNKKTLEIELTSLGGVTKASWLQGNVTCYFQLTDKARACDFYYNFTSRVHSLTGQAGGYACVVSAPDTVALGQRRTSMRITPRAEHVLGLSIWPENQFTSRDPQTDKVKLNIPMLTNEHFQNRQIQILDISAGGLKLKMSSATMKKEILVWETLPGVIIWMVLHDPKRNCNLTLWFRGRIRYTQTDPTTRDICTGLELTSEGIKEKGGKLAWRKVERRMVKELATWTYEQYLESNARGVR